EPVARGEALDRRDLATLRLQREVRAGVQRLAVEEHHAGAALGVVTALLGAGQADGVAHRLEERRARIELDRIADPVHRQRRGNLHAAPPCARATAVSIARRAITAAIAL